MDLNIFWFVALGGFLTGYAVLDGFDLGVGILHLVVKRDEERRTLLNAVGPLWDGNEVWLVIFGGALFAAFPEAYATVFSGFYLAFMALLCALIFRAVSMEFRSKREARGWRSVWDVAFCVASALATLLFGVAVGNSIKGMPIGPDKEFAGVFTDLLGPYQAVVGLLAVATFAMHGSIYLHLKTGGELQERVRGWARRTFGLFVALYALTTVYTLATIPGATRNFDEHPWAWGVVVINALAILNIPRALRRRQPFHAFVSSAVVLVALVALFGLALFPNLIISSLDPGWSVTIYNAASSQKTLTIMRGIALAGMPVVLAYTALIHWVFRGKVDLDRFSY